MTGLRVAGFFAGIGGIEWGLAQSGHEAVHLNEIDPLAQSVLKKQFPGVEVSGDISTVALLPDVDVVTAGFPCTDISQAGRKVGIAGEQSGLIGQVFRLINSSRARPEWLVLENVSYLLRLDGGHGMRYLVDAIEGLGYRWAYRVVDARSFGLPQRRQRVLFVASLTHDPRSVLFADDAAVPAFDDSIGPVEIDKGYGFYWTEGMRGLGWAHDAVPTVKGGSTIGIPSPPAIWYPATGEVGTPQIEDGERLQGFPPDWTLPTIEHGGRAGFRWKQVGNAVCTPMSQWLGERLSSPGEPVSGGWDNPLTRKWALAGYGGEGRSWAAPVGTQPFQTPYSLRKFLNAPLKPLSERATRGFLSRTERGKLRFADGFIPSLRQHLEMMEQRSHSYNAPE